MRSPTRTPQEILIHDTDLGTVGAASDGSDRAHALLMHQRDSWPLLRESYARLGRAEFREFACGRSIVRVQYNPLRMRSTTADVDDRSIRERPCFLCTRNLPAPQRALLLDEGYLLLANPFPIFPEHFTIVHPEHTRQRAGDSFGALLSVSKELGRRYTAFYNGPECGASAPDHLHFQAGSRLYMPLEHEYHQLRESAAMTLSRKRGIEVLSVEDTLRRFIVMESSDGEVLESAFGEYYACASQVLSRPGEPMMNIIVSFDEDLWRVMIFPRATHRPSCFFEEGERRLVISPAAVDLGGVLITPRESDFRRITGADIEQLFREVAISPGAFALLCDRLAARFTEKGQESV